MRKYLVKLRKDLEKHGTVKHVAEAAGVHNTSLTDCLNGRKGIPFSMAYRLEQALGINADKLLYEQLKADWSEYLSNVIIS